MKLSDVHIGNYGAIMGIAGLALTARTSASLFPGVIRAPAYFTELWVLLGVVALLVLLFLYFLKIKNNRQSVVEDLTNPALMGFCGALPVGMTLVAGGLGPYLPALARGLWWLGCAGLVALQCWAVGRWLSGKVQLEKLNAGWLILLVGGIVPPGPGMTLGLTEASRFFFGFSACAAAVLLPLLFARAALAAPLPEPMRPTWFILLVPPSLLYANGGILFRHELFDAFYFASVVLLVALLVYARGFLRWPFAPAWWAFTFPLDAFAFASARYAISHPSEPVWRWLAGIGLALATLAVAMVLVRTLIAIPRRSG